MRGAYVVYGSLAALIACGALILKTRESVPRWMDSATFGEATKLREVDEPRTSDAAQDLAAALKALRTGKDRNVAISEVEILLKSGDLLNAASADLILREAPDGEGNHMLATLVGAWIIRSPEDCLSWLNGAKLNAEDKNLLFVHAYAAWAMGNPAQALASAISDQVSTDVLRTVFASWSRTDFEAALAAYNNSPESVKRSVVETMVLLAAEHDESRAEELLIQFGQLFPDVRDQVRLGRVLLAIDPEMADDLISLEKDQERHAALLTGIRKPTNQGSARAFKAARVESSTEEEIADQTDASLESSRDIGNETRR